MTQKTEAQLCAEALEFDRDMVRRNKRAAVELRRLEQANKELLEVAKAIIKYDEAVRAARAAIAKHGGSDDT